MSPEPSRDLRRLRVRYGDKMWDVTYAAVKEGRPTKGMPTWGPVLGARKISEVTAYILSKHQEGEPIMIEKGALAAK